MKILIVGCGRTGARLGRQLVAREHEVAVVDEKREAFERLGADFPGATYQGSGLDTDVLRRAKIASTDIVFALTGGDNRNLMIVQMVKIQMNVPRAVARLHDPVRAAKYQELGVETLCTTTVIEGLLELYVANGHFPELPPEIRIAGDDSELKI
jgi:trk system potassium uptake protein TrkA